MREALNPPEMPGPEPAVKNKSARHVALCMPVCSSDHF